MWMLAHRKMLSLQLHVLFSFFSPLYLCGESLRSLGCLQLTIVLSQPCECRNYKYEPSCSAILKVLFQITSKSSNTLSSEPRWAEEWPVMQTIFSIGNLNWFNNAINHNQHSPLELQTHENTDLQTGLNEFKIKRKRGQKIGWVGKDGSIWENGGG